MNINTLISVIAIIVTWELAKFLFWMLGILLGPVTAALLGDWADRTGVRLRGWSERKIAERRRGRTP